MLKSLAKYNVGEKENIFFIYFLTDEVIPLTWGTLYETSYSLVITLLHSHYVKNSNQKVNSTNESDYSPIAHKIAQQWKNVYSEMRERI